MYSNKKSDRQSPQAKFLGGRNSCPSTPLPSSNYIVNFMLLCSLIAIMDHNIVSHTYIIITSFGKLS